MLDNGNEITRLYAIVRRDLEMPSGKMAAQAGHAFLEAYLAASRQQPERAIQYASDPPGTKICLAADDLPELLAVRDYVAALGLPYALITDSGHILPPHFDGSPIITALGVGPATRKEVGFIARHLQLM